MVRVTKAAIRRWLSQLLHIKDTPRRTALAYAMGVFFGFSPLLGLHTVLALALAFAFNLNRVATLLGVYSNLPWIIGPYYAFATAAGAVMLGTQLPTEFRADLLAVFDHSPLDVEFWQGTTMLEPLFWPYMVGSTAGALILAIAAHRLALTFVTAQRAHHTSDADGGASA